MKKGKLIALVVGALAVCAGLAVLVAVLSARSCEIRRRTDEALREKAEAALHYADSVGMNRKYCMLLDYSIPSGTPRLFVWSAEKNGVLYRAYAMHGPGMGSTDEKPVFSNELGSYCSCLGRFEVTKEHGVNETVSFRLNGLDSTNFMAMDRWIMIHRSKWVDRHKGRKYIPLNCKACLGCVSVSSRDMNYIYRLVNREDALILLWSYCQEPAAGALE